MAAQPISPNPAQPPPDLPTREVYWNIAHGQIWVMYLLFVIMLAVMAYGVYQYVRLISPGKPDDRSDWPRLRFRSLLIEGLGQRRTLRQRYAGLSHLFFTAGFLVLAIATTVVFIHEDLNLRIMQGAFYLWFQSLTADLFGLLAIVGVVLALVRRGGVGGGRRDRLYHPLDPRTLLDDGVILGGLLVILLTGYVLEGIRIVETADPWGAWSPVGNVTGQVLAGLGLTSGAARAVHGFTWWFHLVLALAWLAYIPYSKLRHIVLSPLNIYFRSLKKRGALSYVDVEKAFERDPPAVGIADLGDLTWKDRLDTQACTECARCEAACPASRTGKALSPMMLILDIRNQMLREAGPLMGRVRQDRREGADPPAEKQDGAADSAGLATAAPAKLTGGVITDPVLWDCTTCRACMEACPVFIEHVPKIVDMRRYLVMAENRFEPDLQKLFDNLEAAGNPWRFPRADRGKWAEGLDVPVLGQDVQVDQVDVLYWVGCAASYDERNQKIARSLANLLKEAGVRFAILGAQETCTGDPARRAGHEYLFQMLAGENVATLNGLGVKTILASCPHCFNTLSDEYPQLDGHYVVRHHAEYLAELVREGKLRPNVAVDGTGNGTADDRVADRSVAYHDPCYLGRYHDIYDQPREVLGSIPGLQLKEVRAGCRNKAMCCGAGGAKIFFEEKRGSRVNHLRVDHIRAESPGRVATSCPFCMIMLEDGTRAKGVYEELPVLDIAEFLHRSIAKPPSSEAQRGEAPPTL